MAVADVYDALTSRRVYKAAIRHDQAIAIIMEGSSKHFDPDVVDAFAEIVNEFKEIADRYAD
jgi:putative two-component system response regulator